MKFMQIVAKKCILYCFKYVQTLLSASYVNNKSDSFLLSQ